jgi:hypothetical protein
MKKITLFVILCLGFQESNAQNTCATALPVSAGTFTVGTIDGSPPPTLCAGTGTLPWENGMLIHHPKIIP